MKIQARKWRFVIAAAVLSSFPLASQGARSVDWPAAYEAQLATRVAQTTPSGGNVGASAAFARFDSIIELMIPAYFKELRNSPVSGLTIIFR